ncbi:MAG: RNA 2',3'-cyclic phosphodiesterase [Pseudomonadota bacterium]
MTETDLRRVFFALWPPEGTLQALEALAVDAAKCCGGRRIRRDSLHMTLAFIGSVSPSQLAVLQEVAGRIRGEAFDLRLDRVGCWSHNRIVWVGCSRVPSRQRRLFDALVANLGEAGFALDKRPFVPHVTLVRNGRCDNLPELAQSIPWGVREFVLVESLLQPSGAHYRLLNRWPLKAAHDKKISKGC